MKSSLNKSGNDTNNRTLPSKPIKSYLIVAVIVVLVIISFIIGLNRQTEDRAALPCTDNAERMLSDYSELLLTNQRVSGIVSDDQLDEVHRLKELIEQQNDQESDINCQYILANYYMYRDLTLAHQALENVQRLYEDGQRLSTELHGASIDALKDGIAFEEVFLEDSIHNTSPIPIAEEDIR